MNNDWLNVLRKRLETESSQDRRIRFERLRAEGLINDRGEVTGHLRRWDASLAITAVERAAGQTQFQAFRCLKPVFGMPGSATIDVSRDSMVAYLKEGKKIITAMHDDRLDMWKQGCEVCLSPQGSIRCDAADSDEDYVGSLPEFQQSNSML